MRKGAIMQKKNLLIYHQKKKSLEEKSPQKRLSRQANHRVHKKVFGHTFTGKENYLKVVECHKRTVPSSDSSERRERKSELKGYGHKN